MAEGESFWTTMPGILTAIGGIILAIATLVTALGGVGFLINPNNQSEDLTTPTVTTVDGQITDTIQKDYTNTVISQPSVEPLSFDVYPDQASRGQEVSLYFTSDLPLHAMVYIDEKPLPKTQLADRYIITIPSSQPEGTGVIKVVELGDGGRTATQYITILVPYTTTPINSKVYRAPPA